MQHRARSLAPTRCGKEQMLHKLSSLPQALEALVTPLHLSTQPPAQLCSFKPVLALFLAAQKYAATWVWPIFVCAKAEPRLRVHAGGP